MYVFFILRFLDAFSIISRHPVPRVSPQYLTEDIGGSNPRQHRQTSGWRNSGAGPDASYPRITASGPCPFKYFFKLQNVHYI